MTQHSMADRRRRSRATAARAVAILGLAAALSGCYTDREVADNYPNDTRQRHPITIREGVRTVEILIGANRGALLAPQRADVFAFGREWRREATGGIVIDVPNGTPNDRAAAAAVGEIRSILAAAEIPADAVVVRPYRPVDPIRLATIRLNYPKMLAQAGPCGLWPHDLGPTSDSEHIQNRPYWNLGCANQRNLAAMVENPADLVQPRGDSPPYAGRRATMFDKYRKGESTATVYPDTNKGKISDIGQ